MLDRKYFLEGVFYDGEGKEKYCGREIKKESIIKRGNSTVKVIHRGMFARIEIFPRCVSVS